ncbi:MAG: arginyltransferase [Gammaproteobacteria bacterium]|nr:arginyltransferase [Gammaproteobacteria bacterium]MCI0590183.1 arginyltransferase [Gammaproteobacteria bacterium]
MNQATYSAKLNFYATPPHECSYLPNRESVTLFADPRFPKSNLLYATLANHGFRRSGEHLYRPTCPTCNACVPIRLPVAEFRPRRRQRRTWRRNTDLTVTPVAPQYKDEHFRLYQDYIAARHKGGGMDNSSPQSYMDFLTSTWADTVFYELRHERRLLGVSVIDRMPKALSAVYTFFDPDCQDRSLGRFSVLYAIREATRLGLSWLYLGYWIGECEKMRYKDEYQPLEYYRNGRWLRQVDTKQ